MKHNENSISKLSKMKQAKILKAKQLIAITGGAWHLNLPKFKFGKDNNTSKKPIHPDK